VIRYAKNSTEQTVITRAITIAKEVLSAAVLVGTLGTPEIPPVSRCHPKVAIKFAVQLFQMKHGMEPTRVGGNIIVYVTQVILCIITNASRDILIVQIKKVMVPIMILEQTVAHVTLAMPIAMASAQASIKYVRMMLARGVII
jgi:hypothetical protein